MLRVCLVTVFCWGLGQGLWAQGFVDPSSEAKGQADTASAAPDSSQMDALLETAAEPDTSPLVKPKGLDRMSNTENLALTDALGLTRAVEQIPLDALRFAQGPSLEPNQVDSLQFVPEAAFDLAKPLVDWDGYWIKFSLDPERFRGKDFVLLVDGPNLMVDRVYQRDIKTKRIRVLNLADYKTVQGEAAFPVDISDDQRTEILLHTYNENLVVRMVRHGSYEEYQNNSHSNLRLFLQLVNGLLVGFAFTALLTVLIRPSLAPVPFSVAVLLLAAQLAFLNHIQAWPAALLGQDPNALHWGVTGLVTGLLGLSALNILRPKLADLLQPGMRTRLGRARLLTRLAAIAAAGVAVLQWLLGQLQGMPLADAVPFSVWPVVLLGLILLAAVGIWLQTHILWHQNISLAAGSIRNVQVAAQLVTVGTVLTLGWHLLQLVNMDFYLAWHSWLTVFGQCFLYLGVGLLLVLAVINQSFAESVDAYLARFLPKHLRQTVIRNGGRPPKKPEMKNNVSVLFTDIKGFSQASLDNEGTPGALALLLDGYFKKFDEICSSHSVERIKTIGDSYMAAGGLVGNPKSGAFAAIRAGLEMQASIAALAKQYNTKWQLRVGINTGPVAEYIMDHARWNYDLWGTTVNLAKDTESKCPVGAVTITQNTYLLVEKRFACEPLGDPFPMKSGQPMQLYRVLHEKTRGASSEPDDDEEPTPTPKTKAKAAAGRAKVRK